MKTGRFGGQPERSVFQVRQMSARKTGGTRKWSTACCNLVVLVGPHPSRLSRGTFPGGEGLGWQRFIRGYAAARGPCP